MESVESIFSGDALWAGGAPVPGLAVLSVAPSVAPGAFRAFRVYSPLAWVAPESLGSRLTDEASATRGPSITLNII